MKIILKREKADTTEVNVNQQGPGSCAMDSCQPSATPVENNGTSAKSGPKDTDIIWGKLSHSLSSYFSINKNEI